MPAHLLPEPALPSKNDLGLTMRDYFAAAALNALLSKPRTETNDEPPARHAEIAYAYADAMLVARSSGLIQLRALGKVIPDDYAVLLGQSGRSLRERIDLTAQILHSTRTELEGMQVRADALAEVFGSDEFTERMKRRQATIAAVDAGFFRRELFVAGAGR